ncbi:hypothetical protein SH661x_004002 [Planctomicrobium sp. SH661]|uniref:hypothetical protein n=1 Tax=Planctomicrobium sp. SH661 TaxID=3448124 RepID=UPI003F5C7FB2
MISLAQLTAVLQNAWQNSIVLDTPTQFPGVPLDAAQLSSWFEFWVTQSYQPPQRDPGLESMELMIDVHCYSRGAEKRHVFTMVDSVRTVLAHQTFPLSTGDDADLTQGVLRIREATVRDLTRELDSQPRLPLQHIVVSFAGAAEQMLA